MVSRSLVFTSLSPVIILSIPLGSHAQLATKTVDDSQVYATGQPDGIQYHPAWHAATNNNPAHLARTYYGTSVSEANLIYFFQGSSIYYYANKNNNSHAPAVIYLDGTEGETVLSNTSDALFRQILWNRTNLGPGDHQVIISHGGKDGELIGLDYLVVESDHGFIPSQAGPAASSIPSDAIIVDDNDLEHIIYSNWELDIFGSKNDVFYFNNTLHRTNQPGSYATFKFNGTAVWYISDYSPDHGIVNITLDDKPSAIVNGSSGSTRALAQRILWNATNLEYGEHSVVLTHQDEVGLYATLDYFKEPPAPQEPKSPTSAIIGGVVGGIALIIICATGYMLARRRRAVKTWAYSDLSGMQRYDGPPLLNPTNEPPPSGTIQPVWGYVTTRSLSQRNQTPGIPMGYRYSNRPRKGQIAQSRVRFLPANTNTLSDPSSVSSSNFASSEGYRYDSGLGDGESNFDPPPYNDPRRG